MTATAKKDYKNAKEKGDGEIGWGGGGCLVVVLVVLVNHNS